MVIRAEKGDLNTYTQRTEGKEFNFFNSKEGLLGI